jgi:hypothetical protein
MGVWWDVDFSKEMVVEVCETDSVPVGGFKLDDLIWKLSGELKYIKTLINVHMRCYALTITMYAQLCQHVHLVDGDLVHEARMEWLSKFSDDSATRLPTAGPIRDHGVDAVTLERHLGGRFPGYSKRHTWVQSYLLRYKTTYPDTTPHT